MTSRRPSLKYSIPSLHSLVLFEASARHLNFSKAAEELSISQPAVSHGIRQLEAALGQQLFVRQPRALSLTSSGVRLFKSVSSGLASIAETLSEIASARQRNVVVVSTSTVMATEWLLPRTQLLHERDPGVLIDLRCTDRDPDLAASGIDIHIRLGDGNWPGYETFRLWPETIVAVCSPEYRVRCGLSADLTDLLGCDLIHYVDPHRYRLGWAEWFRASGVPTPADVPCALRVNDALLALKAAENGTGIALNGRPTIDASIASGRLVLAHPHGVSTGRSFYAVSVSNPGRKRPVAAVCEWLTEQASQAPSEAACASAENHGLLGA